jgi:energy-coupling factor transporter ATP-binding protein EcfA2
MVENDDFNTSQGSSNWAKKLFLPNAELQTESTRLVRLIQPACLQLFHTPEQVAYADLKTDGYHQTLRLDSNIFRDWLARCYYNKYHKTPRAAILQEVIKVLQGIALFEGDECPVYVRLAARGERIYLDLCRPEGAVVEVSPTGWRVINNPPVRFRRPRHLLPLPVPERGGKLDALLSVLNIAAEDWCLIAAWLVATLNPHGPFPLLFVQGEQGTGKSLLAKMLQSLIDPCTGLLRAQPRDLRDLALAATNSWILSFDNLSTLPTWLSDGLCRLSTGGSFTTRILHREDEEVVFQASRPVILTGIEELATRGDLLDRAVLLYLPSIKATQRRTHQQLWTEYEGLQSQLLGALLDAVSVALQRLPNLQLEQLPRMADFTAWVVAASPGLNLAPETFLTAYHSNRQLTHELVLDSMPLVIALRQLMRNYPVWQGTVTELHQVLASYLAGKPQRVKHLPATTGGLSNILRRLAPNLRSLGINVCFHRTNQARLVRIEAVMQD